MFVWKGWASKAVSTAFGGELTNWIGRDATPNDNCGRCAGFRMVHELFSRT